MNYENTTEPGMDDLEEIPRVIIVAANTMETTSKDAERMFSLIKKVVPIAMKRINHNVSFSVDAVNASRSDFGLTCEHKFDINSENTVICTECEEEFEVAFEPCKHEFVPSDDPTVVACALCDNEFEIFRSAEDRENFKLAEKNNTGNIPAMAAGGENLPPPGHR
jgi:hypothetical protein